MRISLISTFLYLSFQPVFGEDQWWSLTPLTRPEVPVVQKWPHANNAIDRFIGQKVQALNLRPSPQADRRTLVRRLYYDLLGLPPSPERVHQFVKNSAPRAYEELVDEILNSKHYGERWARHWLDIVHYGDTHGYDKDKLRPNAWPYRDYVIRSFNDDKNYSRFVREQIAGDVIYPGKPDSTVALGFLAAGPWDFIGHVEVPETKIDGKRSRNLDRDDMVGTVMNTFISTTVQCARCHDHKFDPISMKHYYGLQAVFSALDRADRPYDLDSAVEQRKSTLKKKVSDLETSLQKIEDSIRKTAGVRLKELDQAIRDLEGKAKGSQTVEYGYHSHIEKNQNATKWVQVDLGKPIEISRVEYIGCFDIFANIGAGFGFPVRYKIEACNDPAFKQEVIVIIDLTKSDVVNPGVLPQTLNVKGVSARYVRITATKLAKRSNDYIFALAEFSVVDRTGVNVALECNVTSLDSIEAHPRWRRTNLVDGLYYKLAEPEAAMRLVEAKREREAIYAKAFTDDVRLRKEKVVTELSKARKTLSALPTGKMVFAAATHFNASGGHKPTRGVPRKIHILKRGEVTKPDVEVGPGALPFVPGVECEFALPDHAAEGARRSALAEWIVAPGNPLTWRSIVNRVWQYHFGRGLVSTPNDFGQMGQRPSHSELLDWLAVEFRDGNQSLKDLHRLIVTSATYRQSSEFNPHNAAIDSGNVYLWRMTRRRLDAECVRDAILQVSGKLNVEMYGPGFRDFVLELTAHSPHYEYQKHDPNDPTTHRRSVYRFLARSAPQPFMETLDCADPSQMVAKRNETLTPVSALALLNNKFVVAMSEHFSHRLKTEPDVARKIEMAFELALSRRPSLLEQETLATFARKHGLANTCRAIFNLNEFIYVD